ncbi:hypothetical protein HRJ35_01260 [Shewanella oneidensis MR-1]|uniref:Uncharacterized protein n=1 Tax=Shewanella oneidensis (strain ATCC 700550 / JCM 31522 / CIP 106686 / LMG 19005 / NCIMB 14063 / MR-1) TaxID=211586 RepID=Q8E914_SHEON|nr:hypothetical protein [Shewanella oneidensis]AAN57446.1 uncharacterized protein SO_4481 [Shewanella oneidensis MR-1]MDX5998256.1 hypothetical protein [Shewanella oneidensis]MEE2029031.1 hypothetical protein [Shewanella oneidensis]QKG94762.1 hypothetical protein HRJ35_01260 [Shewanella oneidensis MR-1]
MQPITAFTLRVSDTEAITQPLFFNHQHTGVSIAGVQIEAQYRCQLPNGAQGYLLLTSYDCPFEESLEFSLLDDAFSLVTTASLAREYASFLLYSHWPIAENRLRLHFYNQLVLDLVIEPRSFWFSLSPKLLLAEVVAPQDDPHTKASMEALAQYFADVSQSHDIHRK